MPTRELHVRAVLLAGCAIVAAVFTAIGAVFLLLRHWQMPLTGAAQPTPPVVAGPALQPAPQLDLAAYRAEKQAQLDGSGWVDQAHGVARIPITDAMDLLVQRTAAAATARRRGHR